MTQYLNLQPPNDTYIRRTAPLTSRCCILYIYSKNIRTEYFKHAAHSPFFPLENAVYFIVIPFVVPVLFTFYIQGVNNSKIKLFRVHNRVFIFCLLFHILQKISCPKEFISQIFERKRKLILNSLISNSFLFKSSAQILFWNNISKI